MHAQYTLLSNKQKARNIFAKIFVLSDAKITYKTTKVYVAAYRS